MHSYISIEGNIGAGKTSLAKLLAEEWQGKLVLEEFADNPFLPKFYENRERYAFPLELSFLAERYSQLKEVLNSMDMFNRRIVSDYFISKCLIFSKANLSGAEYDLFAKMFYIIEQNLPQPDLMVYLHLPIDQLLENIAKRGRAYEQSISAEYLAEVQQSYMGFIKQHPNRKIIVLDTSNLDFVNIQTDFEKVKDLLLVDYAQGVHHIQV